MSLTTDEREKAMQLARNVAEMDRDAAFGEGLIAVDLARLCLDLAAEQDAARLSDGERAELAEVRDDIRKEGARLCDFSYQSKALAVIDRLLGGGE